jgi:hypothetical protein
MILSPVLQYSRNGLYSLLSKIKGWTLKASESSKRYHRQ